MKVRALSRDRFAILSDIHLGRPGAGYACTLADDQLSATIAALKARWGTVIVNGDLFDLDRSALPLRRAAELERLWATHFPLVHGLRGPEVFWLGGNHDAILAHLAYGEDALRIQTSQGDVWIEHGHRFDAWIKQQRTFTHLVTWASGHVATVGLDGVFSVMRRLERLLTHTGRDDQSGIERGAARWLQSQTDLSAMVIGHTHRSHAHQLPSGQWLVGSGQGMEAPLRFAAFDAREGVVQLGIADGDAVSIAEEHPWRRT